MANRFQHLNCLLKPLVEGEDPPASEFEMVAEEQCPCGCLSYVKDHVAIIDGYPPMNVHKCLRCNRIRMNVRKP
jgi:hypothetical protein